MREINSRELRTIATDLELELRQMKHLEHDILAFTTWLRELAASLEQ